MSERFSLAGKTALVTGGGSGIGAAVALGMSDAGAKVLLVGRRRALLEEALGDRSGDCFDIDLAEDSAPAELCERVRAAGHAPDIVLNAAGVNLRQHADDVDEAGWRLTLRLNLEVPFFVAQGFLPELVASSARKSGGGRIINIASLQSERAFPNGIAYGASKGGVTQMTRAMAEAWGPKGITANALAPGFFPTELTAAVFNDEKRAGANAAQTCLGRNGEMDDLIGPAVFFASDAGRYVTGQILYVDGGFTAK
jgi:NAD(P)-dependent dehydrogenase (short-subunit alcohol dehydrogenase family)